MYKQSVYKRRKFGETIFLGIIKIMFNTAMCFCLEYPTHKESGVNKFISATGSTNSDTNIGSSVKCKGDRRLNSSGVLVKPG